MGLLLPRWQRYRDLKPVGPVEIDWNNALTRGLEIALPYTTTLINVVNGAKPLVAAGNGIILNRKLEFDGSDLLGVAFEIPQLNSSDKWTLISTSAFLDNDVDPVYARVNNNSSVGYDSAGIGRDTSVNNETKILSSGNTPGRNPPSLATGTYYCAALTHSGAGSLDAHIDGVFSYNVTHTDPTDLDGIDRVIFGASGRSGNTEQQSHIHDLFFSRELSFAELVEIYRAPYQFYKPRRRFISISAGGGSAISPAGIASQEALGDATLSPGSVVVSPGAIGSAEALGSPVLTVGGINLLATSIPSGETSGIPLILPGSVLLTVSGIGSEEALGNPTVQPGSVVVAPNTILSAEVFGAAGMTTGAKNLNPSGIGSAESLGLADLLLNPMINAQGIASSENVGVLALSTGSVDVNPAGIVSAEGFGFAALQAGSIVIIPDGLASLEAVGNAILIQGAAVLMPSGVPSQEALGQITIIGGTAIIGWLEGRIIVANALLDGRIDVANALLADPRINDRVH